MDPVRTKRLRDLAQLIACEVQDRGDAILIVREIAQACAAKVNETAVSLLARTAGVVAAEIGLTRSYVATLASEAYGQALAAVRAS